MAKLLSGTRVYGNLTVDANLTITGSIIPSANVTYDLGSIISASGLIYPDQFVLPTFTVSTLPSAITPAQMIYVSDESGGATVAFSDGTNWRRVQDRAIVS